MSARIRKAYPAESETLADIAFLAWDKDLRPLLSGAAADREVERRRLSPASQPLFDHPCQGFITPILREIGPPQNGV